jgi:hypothetical protein
VSACATDDDCQLRATGCCESCVPMANDLLALAKSKVADYVAQICAPGSGACPPVRSHVPGGGQGGVRADEALRGIGAASLPDRATPGRRPLRAAVDAIVRIRHRPAAVVPCSCDVHERHVERPARQVCRTARPGRLRVPDHDVGVGVELPDRRPRVRHGRRSVLHVHPVPGRPVQHRADLVVSEAPGWGMSDGPAGRGTAVRARGHVVRLRIVWWHDRRAAGVQGRCVGRRAPGLPGVRAFVDTGGISPFACST